MQLLGFCLLLSGGVCQCDYIYKSNVYSLCIGAICCRKCFIIHVAFLLCYLSCVSFCLKMKFPFPGQEKVVIKSNSDKSALQRKEAPLSGIVFYWWRRTNTSEHFSSMIVCGALKGTCFHRNAASVKGKQQINISSVAVQVQCPVQGHHTKLLFQARDL